MDGASLDKSLNWEITFVLQIKNLLKTYQVHIYVVNRSYIYSSVNQHVSVYTPMESLFIFHCRVVLVNLKTQVFK